MIDWNRPWFDTLVPTRREPGSFGDAALPVHRQLDALAGGGAPRFVPATVLPPGEAYETQVARTGEVPTRDNLHDLLNGLVWLRCGPLKRRLNALHAAALGRDGVGAGRGPLRDALTLFDECGALWDEPDPLLLLLALRERDWQGLFVRHRARWRHQRLAIVGHGLLEQLATAPRKALTAHVLARDPLALSEAQWASKPFLPLPVLGIPGWWPGQDDPDFYDDPKVFRATQGLKSTPAP